ncbi:MAG TPA: acylphosphatase [Stellaceae bacterium]|jgi:acylphosphatase|nr:acylphosphatase [Stellaceae bacterium]
MARSAFFISVTGQVQGVGFRAFVRRRATELGLDGWVRNRRDGSVEITAIGDPEQVDQLVAECTNGPTLAKVEEITVRGADDDGTTGFRERSTV